MKEDGIHENFWGGMPEMPWKRKEREMDNEYKKLVLKMLLQIVYMITEVFKFPRKDFDSMKSEVDEYVRKLG